MNEDLSDAIAICKGLWLSVRSNRYFVAFEGGALGVLGKFLDDAAFGGHSLDLSPAGLKHLALSAAVAGYVAVRLLVRPAPGSSPTSNQ